MCLSSILTYLSSLILFILLFLYNFLLQLVFHQIFFNYINLLIFQEGENPIQNEILLRKYDYFQLKIHLKKGKDLIARDKNGMYIV